MRSVRSGLTMVELLVSIGIILLLLGLLLPAIMKGRAAARNTECQNHLRQLALGFRLYADAHGGRLPNTETRPWFADIAPFLEMQEEIYRCPADSSGVELGYNWRDDGAFLPEGMLSGRKLDAVAKSELVLLYDSVFDRHAPGMVNVALVGGAVRSMAQEEFDLNMLLVVDTGDFPQHP